MAEKPKNLRIAWHGRVNKYILIRDLPVTTMASWMKFRTRFRMFRISDTELVRMALTDFMRKHENSVTPEDLYRQA